MKKVTDRAAMNGKDFQWLLFSQRDSVVVKCDGVIVTASGGKDRILDSQVCGAPPHLMVNFVEKDRLIGTDWMDGDFTDAIRIEFNPAVKAVGVQYAVTSDTNNIEFTALMRASTEGLIPKVCDKSNNAGITKAIIGDPDKPDHLLGHYPDAAIFLGIKAEGAERIKVIRVDVKPRGQTSISDILGFYINRLCIEA